MGATAMVAALAGESWDLAPAQTGAAVWRRIAPGQGTARTVRVFQPGRNAQATDAG
jgi:hypothetical protein